MIFGVPFSDIFYVLVSLYLAKALTSIMINFMAIHKIFKRNAAVFVVFYIDKKYIACHYDSPTEPFVTSDSYAGLLDYLHRWGEGRKIKIFLDTDAIALKSSNSEN